MLKVNHREATNGRQCVTVGCGEGNKTWKPAKRGGVEVNAFSFAFVALGLSFSLRMQIAARPRSPSLRSPLPPWDARVGKCDGPLLCSSRLCCFPNPPEVSLLEVPLHLPLLLVLLQHLDDFLYYDGGACVCKWIRDETRRRSTKAPTPNNERIQPHHTTKTYIRRDLGEAARLLGRVHLPEHHHRVAPHQVEPQGQVAVLVWEG